ncbi:MAG: twin-arginine translocase TatA/TatE family subunit [Campylobacterota bacterium]|nr:twin-arginine translocase TatA/TatE family subunit [Campylobacterota bacterium]
MGMPSMPELLIILAIVVLLFGAKKIPDLAKGVGKGIKDFKKAVKEDDEADAKTPTAKPIESTDETKVVDTKAPETKSENA